MPFLPVESPVYAAPTALVQAVADPADPIRWTLVPPSGQTYTLAEINASRMTIFVAAQADAVILNPTSTTAAPVNAAGSPFTCVAAGANFECVTTQNAGTILGTTAAGTYRVALGMEFRRLTGVYASRVVSAICTFQFPVVDNRPSIQPTNVRVAAS